MVRGALVVMSSEHELGSGRPDERHKTKGLWRGRSAADVHFGFSTLVKKRASFYCHSPAANLRPPLVYNLRDTERADRSLRMEQQCDRTRLWRNSEPPAFLLLPADIFVLPFISSCCSPTEPASSSFLRRCRCLCFPSVPEFGPSGLGCCPGIFLSSCQLLNYLLFPRSVASGGLFSLKRVSAHNLRPRGPSELLRNSFRRLRFSTSLFSVFFVALPRLIMSQHPLPARAALPHCQVKPLAR